MVTATRRGARRGNQSSGQAIVRGVLGVRFKR